MIETLTKIERFVARLWKPLWLVVRVTWAMTQLATQIVIAIGLILFVLVLTSAIPLFLDEINSVNESIKDWRLFQSD